MSTSRGGAVAEQGTGNAFFAVRRPDSDGDERVIIDLAIVTNFPDVEPALLREEGRVDHVYRVGIGAHQARQHRARNRLDVELGGRAFDLDGDRADVRSRDLSDEASELLGKRHIGPQPRCFLGRKRRHVHGIGDPAEQQEICHLLGDLDRDIHLRLVGRSAKVRSADQVRRSEQRILVSRLLDEDVKRRPCDVPALQSLP